MFMRVVRELLVAFGGYESKEVDGMVLATFKTPPAAAEWALALQLALLDVPWPSGLSVLSATSTVVEPVHGPAALFSSYGQDGVHPHQFPLLRQQSNSTVSTPNSMPSSPSFHHQQQQPHTTLFKGVRVRIGIFHGPIDRVVPHGKSGRADYLGTAANRAARLMAAAQGGQIMMELNTAQSIYKNWGMHAVTSTDHAPSFGVASVRTAEASSGIVGGGVGLAAVSSSVEMSSIGAVGTSAAGSSGSTGIRSSKPGVDIVGATPSHTPSHTALQSQQSGASDLSAASILPRAAAPRRRSLHLQPHEIEPGGIAGRQGGSHSNGHKR